MGKKADAIQNELENERRKNEELRRQLEAKREIDQRYAPDARGRVGAGAPGMAMTRHPPRLHRRDNSLSGGGFHPEAMDEAEAMLDHADDEADAARTLQIRPDQAHQLQRGESVWSAEDEQTFNRIAAKLNIEGTSAGGTLRLVEAALDGLHHGDVEPAFVKDTLAQSIEHNRKERYDLDENLREARGVITRIAAALNVSEYKKDGEAIIERAQRYVGLSHTLKQRLQALTLADRGADASTHPDYNEVVEFGRKQELTTILTLLVGNDQVAKWIANKPKVTASDKLLDAAAASRPAEKQFNSMEILQAVLRWLETSAPPANQRLADEELEVGRLFKRVNDVAHARRELTDFVNVILVPLLARAGA